MAKLQADLEEMQPQLEQAQVETEQTMAKIEKDSGEYHVCSCESVSAGTYMKMYVTVLLSP